MTPSHTATPAPAGTGNGRQNDLAGELIDRTRTPSPSSAQWLRRDMIAECAAIIGSLAVSIGEAAWRGSDSVIGIHIDQMRAVAREMVATYRDLAEGRP